MKKYVLVLVACLMLTLTGCAGLLNAIDAGFGYNPETGQDEQGIVDSAAGLATPWLPWSTTAVGLLGSLWASIRGKRYKEAGKTVIAGVFDAKLLADELKDEDGKLDASEYIAALMAKLGDRQGKSGNRELIRELADYVERRYF